MWRIEFTKKAEKQFDKLDRQTQEQINDFLDRLLKSKNHYSSGKPIVGELSGLWRYRVGKYRIICEIQNNVLLVEIISIGKRDGVYK